MAFCQPPGERMHTQEPAGIALMRQDADWRGEVCQSRTCRRRAGAGVDP